MNFQKIKADLQRVYDDLALYWGQDKTLHDWGEDDLLSFARLVGKGAKVLDLGCASGYQSKLLRDQGLNVVGLDLSPRMIVVAKKRVTNVDFVVGDMTNLTFKFATFNGVYARASLLHIPKKLVPKVLKSVHRILKDKGIFYLALKEGKGESEVEDERHGVKVKRFFSFFSEKEIVDLLNDTGFRIESVNFYQRDKRTTKWIEIFAKKI
ncbi:hypothetical protein A3A60_04380 [Candidatus Curtissbacteria bacterium RIFCSPLOWO2_01_FULL_42_26]|uniref:Methyltransferase domain-containing protein n=1 Tax=Candidatus Curtissbacteria bacterium RIFCSPLOWO2_01_FULL_42_26 TaxID=1797729 RepID=A0A1F5HVV4_9BACT|nr:MAG: hypothetical protein A3A60_04380 [Candidatus Curtissbacteria bacterium RIFCSPLOWO2_01_FULL_42_26]